MAELAISIAVNVVLGALLLALLYRRHTQDSVVLNGPDEAKGIFGLHFADAGELTMANDKRGALFDLKHGEVGLLQRHGRRWNARILAAGDISSVELAEHAIKLKFADFGWPRAQICIEDDEVRAMWTARLKSLTVRGTRAQDQGLNHA
jgi:hypothetical protein